jgi:hypothetical protein
VDPPISEGPFYEKDGVDFAEFGFMPDANFLAGRGDTPTFMHRISMR